MTPRFHAFKALSACWFASALLVSFGGEPSSVASLDTIQSVTLESSPLVLRNEPGKQRLVLSWESPGLSNVTLRVRSTAWAEPLVQQHAQVAKGRQEFLFEVPTLTSTVEATAEVLAGDATRTLGSFPVRPPRHWTVYLTQHTHTDIGYTRPQTEILPEHLRYIDYALDYCDLTDALPDDARFRWTCETAWAVREYVRSRPPVQLERLKRRLADGRIEVCGLLLNMSEIATESALAALVRPLRGLKEDLGVTVVTAMQNDVNGAGWCLPDYFQGLGIRYLSMGINETRSILPFDKPTCFWWESPSGKRVLAYRSDHYMTANFWGLEKGRLDDVRPQVMRYLLSLERRAYPFDRVGVQFSGYFTDNSPPSTAACDVVKAWNEAFDWPRLRLSTAHEFLAHVEQAHANDLPVHRQAWPDWWTDGFGSAARETAAARETETMMQVNHGLLAMATLAGQPARAGILDRAGAIQDDLLFYHEHTYGAAESISDPLAENAQVQWGEKASYVWSAVKDANLLREEALGLLQQDLPRADVASIAVFNTLNWSRSALVRVFIDHEILHPDHEFRILDGGEPVLAQTMERRAEGTYWALWVRDVPAFGYKTLRIERSEQARAKEPSLEATSTLENRFYRLTLDPERGALRSWLDKETGRELVDAGSTWALGQCVYETMPPNREIKPGTLQRTTWRNLDVKPGANGPIWRSLRVSADLDGAATNRGVHAEIRLYEPEKRVELHYALRKLPVASPEAVYVAFPFASPEGRLLYEAQGGLVTPGADQLPGSSADWQTLQSFVSIQSPGGQIIQGSDQVPLVQFGDFNLGKWMRVARVDKPHVYSWVMNNYWFTNFRNQQEGEFRWHYYLTSTGDTGRATATRFGWGSRVPLVTRVLAPATSKQTAARPAQRSFLGLRAPNVFVVEARPAVDGSGVVCHLREVEGKAVTLTEADLVLDRAPAGVDEVNVLEQTTRADIESLTLAPYEVKFVCIRL